MPSQFSKWLDIAREATRTPEGGSKGRTVSRGEVIKSREDRLKGYLRPLFEYINELIEQEVFG